MAGSSMNILAWNCRGGGGIQTQQFLRSLLLSTRADIAFISETKSSVQRSFSFIQTLPLSNFEVVSAQGLSRGLWLMWGPHVNLTVFEKTKHYFFARIEKLSEPTWLLACIYGDASYRNNPAIWEDLTRLASTNILLVCIGDFNAITDAKEKFGGNTTLNSNSLKFKQFLFDTGLMDLGFKGPAFTWTNRPNASSALHVRLDRAVANTLWYNQFPDAYVNHLHRVHNDHCLILLRTKSDMGSARKFRIENWWLQHENFTQSWALEWLQNQDDHWESKYRNLKANILRWARSTETPQKKLRRLEAQILELQQQHPLL